jgi:hypothetical protein
MTFAVLEFVAPVERSMGLHTDEHRVVRDDVERFVDDGIRGRSHGVGYDP